MNISDKTGKEIRTKLFTISNNLEQLNTSIKDLTGILRDLSKQNPGQSAKHPDPDRQS